MADGINLILSLLVLASCAVMWTRGDPNEYRLVRDLMKGYDKRIRPSLNHTDSLNVTFGLALVQIIDVDEKNQILTTNCWLNQIWTDYNLRWDPAKYGGIKVLRLPYDEVWKPDILLHNNAEVSTFVSSTSSNLIVTNDGNVTWFSMVIFKSSCSINVRYFPFDAQNCSMQFASWSYDGYQVNLIMNTEKGDTSNYIHNSEWELIYLQVERTVRIFSCCEEPYPDIHFHILIKRRPLFYIFNMILPCILITLVALLGFYIPSDSGEKVTMGITTLLSMTVFMMLVTENMPPTSDVLPLIGIYYGMTIFIVSFATAMTVFTLNIHHKGSRGKAVPMVIKKICFDFLAKMFCMKVDTWDEKHFTPDCNGTPGGASNYIRFKVANQQDTDQLNMELKQTHEMSPLNRVELPLDSESFQSNGAVPRAFTSFRSSNGNGGSSSEQQNTELTGFEAYFSRVLQRVYQTIERNDIRLAEQDKREGIKLEWQQVAQITDRLLLTCFVLVTLTITGVVLLASPASVKV
ncbi:ligand-gated ion channel 4-like precursor [Aplysia californica]|uniref:Ligand-gated ion channel 4-like precursor n=1 Tax=Aplysia californica TaxID=6500 RepID=R4UXK5_APLCA|nr:ligand-gated ion channel 4-like precursor [Aplysia californica]AGM37745.1 nicotinic acetylcholine receptor subunit type L [Aplysia californica]